jgi:hypothetical protein
MQEAKAEWVKVRAAQAIQAQWRVHRLHAELLQRIQAARSLRDSTFARLQQHLADNWGSILSQHRIIVHMPSLSLSPAQRSSISKVASIPILESAQISRLCDTADPQSDVVFVAPAPMDPAVEQYWTKLLEAGGVADASSRFRIIHPENYVRLPERFSLSAKLLASPRALKRLKLMLQGRPAFIVPGIVGDAEIDLAVLLGIPVLGSHPAVAAAVASKTGARALFRHAHVNVAPGQTVRPVEGPLAPPKPPDTTTNLDASLLMDFTLEPDGLRADQQRVPPQPRVHHERKDAILCEALASMMVKQPMTSVRGPFPGERMRTWALLCLVRTPRVTPTFGDELQGMVRETIISCNSRLVISVQSVIFSVFQLAFQRDMDLLIVSVGTAFSLEYELSD